MPRQGRYSVGLHHCSFTGSYYIEMYPYWLVYKHYLFIETLSHIRISLSVSEHWSTVGTQAATGQTKAGAEVAVNLCGVPSHCQE